MRAPLLVLAGLLSACAASPAPSDGGPTLRDFPPGIGIARLRDYRFARASSTDPTGGNRDYRPIAPGAELVLADLEGPAVITHLWFTISKREARNQLWLRAWWDGEAEPSVDAPLGLFFGAGHDDARIAFFTNIFFDVSPQLGLNCHMPMPFRRHGKLTLTNKGSEAVDAVYYYVDYSKVESVPDDVLYLHARHHSEDPCTAGRDYVFAEGSGIGHIVGVNLAVEARADHWWGEGDDKITVDGEPIQQGTGTEDYFCGAWNFRAEHAGLYEGSPRIEAEKTGGKHCVYRFHETDPIPFSRSFRYAIEHGHANDRADHWSSVAYWYQFHVSSKPASSNPRTHP